MDFVAELSDDGKRVLVESFANTTLVSVMFKLARMLAEDPELRYSRDVWVKRVGGLDA